MKRFFLLLLLLNAVFAHANTPPLPAPDFTVTTSDGQVKKLYQDYIQQQKVVVIEAFFTTCPPCSAHAPFLQSLYTEMQAAYPGQVEFILLSTLLTDTNIKVAQYKTNKGLTMPGCGQRRRQHHRLAALH
jgi:peroxiredoxin